MAKASPAPDTRVEVRRMFVAPREKVFQPGLSRTSWKNGCAVSRDTRSITRDRMRPPEAPT
jgi:hypothetical protein